MDLPTLKQELMRDEGVRLKPYTDSVGKLTIGVGRNLSDVGISLDEAGALLDHDIARTQADLDAHLPWWRNLDPVRQRVMVNLCFNMGIGDNEHGLLSFAKTLALFQAGRYLDGANAMLRSKWAQQVGARATRLATMMRDGGQT